MVPMDIFYMYFYGEISMCVKAMSSKTQNSA